MFGVEAPGRKGSMMLDLDHPQTPHVFAASRQLNLILDYLRRITYADNPGRLRMLEIIRPCFAALRWVQTQRFAGEPHIAAGIDELERAAERLAQLGDGRADGVADDMPPSRCPVCRRPLTTSGVYEPRPGLKVPKERWCSPCLEGAMPALQRVQSSHEGFRDGRHLTPNRTQQQTPAAERGLSADFRRNG
jgi:hypothetical protein